MKVTIDDAGRLVLPESVRERLGIGGGGELELRPTAGGIELRPAAENPRLVREGRVLVYQPDQPADRIDVAVEIEAIREARTEGPEST
jgi:AbrB family looped-hinge helix DNA binding protein